jgi:membrane protein DedA with SNARE-associated domain
MDMLPEMLQVWLLDYGSFALFFLLALGIIALPVPEETLLIFSGYLIHKGTFSFLPTFLFAYSGSIVGITVSYLIGHTGGLYIIKKYGSYIGLTNAKMDQAHSWFEHYGKWVLFIGYFVPGVCHFTGISAGITNLEYHYFALYAYTGALFWVLLFISVGYFFGSYNQTLLEFIEKNVEVVFTLGTLFILAIIGMQLWRVNKKRE